MAKKKTLKTQDDSSYDDFLLPDFDYDLEPTKDDRKPITKLLKGTISGAGSTLASEAFIKKTIRSNMPDGYGEALDFYEELESNTKKLYHNAAKQTRPIVNELARTVDSMVPAKAKRTKKFLDRIKDLTGDVDYSRDEKAERENTINAALTGIFAAQAEETVRRENIREAREQLQEAIATTRHKENFHLLNQISLSTQRLAQYQDKVNAAFQKKSLELQYRQYFLAVDLLKEQKESNKRTFEALNAITKNTGLPDIVKLKGSEYMKHSLKNKFLDSAMGGLFGRDGLIGKITKNVGDVLTEKVTGFGYGLLSALGAGEMAAAAMGVGQDQEDDLGFGPDKHSVIGKAAGAFGVEIGKSILDNRLTRKLGKSERLRKGGQKGKFWAQNYAQLLNEFSKRNLSYMEGPKGSFLRFLQDLVPGMGIDTTLKVDKMGSFTQPGTYTLQANKSITEIIPGYLARIFRELQVIRTGKTDISLTTYDYTKNRFADSETAKKNALELVAGKKYIENTQSELKSFINLIDPDGKLSPKARMALGKQLLTDNLGSRLGSAERFTDVDTFLKNEGSKPYAKEIVAAFSKFYNKGKDGSLPKDSAALERENLVAGRYNQLGRGMKDARKYIQELVNMGVTDMLDESGLYAKDEYGRDIVDMDKLISMYAGTYKYSPGESFVAGDEFSKRSGLRRFSFSNLFGGGRGKSEKPVFDSAIPQRPMYDLPKKLEVDLDPLKLTIETIVGESNLLLERIEDAIKAGIEVNVTQIQEQTGGAITPSSGIGARLKDLFSRGAKSTARGLGKAAWKTFTGAGKLTARAIGSGFRTTAWGMKGLFGAAKKVGGWLLSGGKKIHDIYVGNEIEPRLQAIKLKAGKYKDMATGKIIETIDDIKGAVVDIDTEEVVLKASELKDTFIKQLRGSTFVKTALDLGKRAAYTILGGGISAGGLLLKGARKVKDFIMDALDRPTDVYVRGEDSPRLLSILFANGAYFSKTTGQAITSPGKIDGEVVDAEGNVLITNEDLQKGLVDKYGVKVTSRATRLLVAGAGIVGGVFGRAMSVMRNIKTGLGGWLSGKMKGGAEFVSDFVSAFTGGIGGREGINVLKDIRRILDDRLAKKVKGDTDGDGLRDGSWQELLGRKKEEGEGTGILGPDGKPISSGEGEKRENVFDMITRKKREAKRDMIETAQAIESLGKTLDFLSKLPMIGGLAAKLGGLLGFGAKAATVATTVASGTAAAGTAGAAGTAVAGTAATAGAVLSAPVVLGAAAVAAVGAGGYFAYKHYKKKKAKALSTLRAAQYGFDASDKSHENSLDRVFKMEEYLDKQVKFVDDKAQLSDGDFDTNKVFSEAGINPNDPESTELFTQWFTRRFKPVYLTWATAVHAVNRKGTVSEADELKDFEKKKLLELVKFTEGPYGEVLNPFGGEQLVGSDVVSREHTRLTEVYSKIKDKGRSVTITESQKASIATAGISTAALQAESEEKMKKEAQSKSFFTYLKESPLGKLLGRAFKYSGAGIALALGKKSANIITMAAKSVGTYLGFGVSAEEAVRFKTYGLKKMDASKVIALRKVERRVGNGLKMTGSGAAQFAESPEEIIRDVGGPFGVDSIGNEYAKIWIAWFTKRFLPVFLEYRTKLREATGQDNQENAEKALKPSQKTTIAREIGAMDVWDVSESPWKYYELNTDRKSIEENMQLLEDKSKDEQLQEDKKSTTTDPVHKQNQIKKDIEQRSTPEPANSNIQKTSHQISPFVSSDHEDQSYSDNKSGGAMTMTQATQKDEGVSITPSAGANIPMAGGELYDGRDAEKYLTIANGETLKGAHPEMLRNFYGMVAEYGKLTGKKVRVNAGFRTYAMQAALRKRNPRKAARPGSSLHEFGLAIDINTVNADEMDKLGLMKKYGFTRPVGGETWHIEPSGLYSDIQGFKTDHERATIAIKNSIGRGGGGYGSIRGTPMGKRNHAMAQKIANADTPPGPPPKLPGLLSGPNTPGTVGKGRSSGTTLTSAGQKLAGMGGDGIVSAGGGSSGGSPAMTSVGLRQMESGMSSASGSPDFETSGGGSGGQSVTYGRSAPVKANSAADAIINGPLGKMMLKAEGDYGIANYKKGKKFRVKNFDPDRTTLGQIMQMQANGDLYAVGRYQIIPLTLKEAVSKLGLNKSALFNKAMQDKIFVEYLLTGKRPALGKYLFGKSNDIKAAHLDFSREWASVAAPKGVKTQKGFIGNDVISYYYGNGVDKASVKGEEARRILSETRALLTGKSFTPTQDVSYGRSNAVGAGGGEMSSVGLRQAEAAMAAGSSAAGGSYGSESELGASVPPAYRDTPSVGGGDTGTPAADSGSAVFGGMEAGGPMSSVGGAGGQTGAPDTMGAGFSNIESTLQKSLDVQTKTMGVIVDIYNYLKSNGKAAATNAVSLEQAAQEKAANEAKWAKQNPFWKKPEQATKGPVTVAW